MTKRKRIFVGLSGGVDSSVATLRLLDEGHDVTGVFIKVWQPDFIRCDWEKERLDAMRVAATLGIPFLTCDATERYRKDVVEYLIREYRDGRTPNPDVMCNTHVKFSAFFDFAREQGADAIATGHYARIETDTSGAVLLMRSKDAEKDQSYFLWNIPEETLRGVHFPVGDSIKEIIRKEARARGLPTAEKPDSQGICFLGAIDMKEFLSHYIEPRRGDVVDEEGRVIGEHDGVLFFTIGQRHGFTTHHAGTNGRPHYVVRKDTDKNILIVSHDMPKGASDARTLTLRETNWIGDVADGEYDVQVRYRQKPVRGTLKRDGDGGATIILKEMPDAVASGQSCVLYDGARCVGGGIIAYA